ncbi:MAG: hypothetical protein AAGD47_01085 [Pseudomonadota bacterium]
MRYTQGDDTDLDGSVTRFDRASRQCLTEAGLPALVCGALGVSGALWAAIVWVL